MLRKQLQGKDQPLSFETQTEGIGTNTAINEDFYLIKQRIANLLNINGMSSLSNMGIIFTGGKGGIGKSLLSANVAVALAKLGISTALFDTEARLAKQRSVFFQSMIKPKMAEIIEQHEAHKGSGWEVMPGLSLYDYQLGLDKKSAQTKENISYTNDNTEYVFKKINAFFNIEEAAYGGYILNNHKILILDIGAGNHETELAYSHLFKHSIIVTTPERTAIEDGLNVYRSLVTSEPTIDYRTYLLLNQAGMNNTNTNLSNYTALFEKKLAETKSLKQPLTALGTVGYYPDYISGIRKDHRFFLPTYFDPKTPLAQEYTAIAQTILKLSGIR